MTRNSIGESPSDAAVRASAGDPNRAKQPETPPVVRRQEECAVNADGIVVIGASLGGTKAFTSLLAALPGDFPIPLAIVLHRGVDSDASLQRLFQSESVLPVWEAEDKMRAAGGHIYLAPADYHLLVGKTGFSLSTEAPVAFARPSIDVLFDSASATHGSKTLGILLTGASADGAWGAVKIRERGGFVVVQDPATAECPIMPQAAIAAAAASVILPLDAISGILRELSQGKHRGPA